MGWELQEEAALESLWVVPAESLFWERSGRAAPAAATTLLGPGPTFKSCSSRSHQLRRLLRLFCGPTEWHGNVCPWGRVGELLVSRILSALAPQQALPVKVTAGKVRLEDKQRLEQEQQSEEKRLAIMMMKKREKYLYKKIMFGKKRKVREANKLAAKRKAHDTAVKEEKKKSKKARRA
ncbi:hypothetical protein AV530_014224 [Patagioenas fasciata monilis]|uniref:Uncharacterized protein n=1 Tax=Patagioenas fasciata monilis TaxID=372326 RepID=A0A1V4JST2_PATFA|nr:hypothetical protein AV530_014224 [Patagioenas fasciata monilis]